MVWLFDEKTYGKVITPGAHFSLIEFLNTENELELIAIANDDFMEIDVDE